MGHQTLCPLARRTSRSFILPRRASLLFLLFLLTGCSSKGCQKVTPVPNPDSGTTPASTTNGLVGAEQGRWRHLAEGSELYPLAWLLALENPDTGKPFLDNPERFGLLPDGKSEENPFALPVGITADYTRDLRFAGVQMIGVNCAGCHVNELRLNNEPVLRIDGAPNLFDLELFLSQLAAATEKTFTDTARAWRFARKLYEVYHPPSGATAALTRLARPADDTLRSFESLAQMKEGDLGKQLAEQIETLHKAEMNRPAADLNKGLVVRPPENTHALHEYSSAVKKKSVQPSAALSSAASSLRLKTIGPLPATNADKIAAVKPTQNHALAKLSVEKRSQSISDALSHFVETIRLLKARAAFLLGLARSRVAHTEPGFGRVDAFGSARNRFFPTDKKPTTAPISYPHLWDLNQLVWLHWDANTTSVLERNAGQAIGLGALFDPDTFDSTLIIDNLVTLEQLARKITPPRWPDQFGAIDQEKATRGKAVFDKHCVVCHKPVGPGGKVADDLVALDKIGTDPTRLENFALDADGKPFDVALSAVLKALVRRGGGTTADEKLWRVTRKSPNRPLTAIWATAPYLHNNSVPTLYDLLQPAAKRPPRFPVGHREYDPVKLGYSARAGTPSFPFDTSKTGNGNGGHEFGTAISEEERMALLEYLKTI
jgi:mono/diheme cytochrome c family protein